MIIHVVGLLILQPYVLELEFDNGEKKRVDLRRELYGPVFEPLIDPNYFARAFIDPDSRTVTWPNGADFAPDFLYQLEPYEVEVSAD
jgi:hypothetical protein